MNLNFLQNLDESARHSLILLKCDESNLQETITQLNNAGVNSVNVGKALAEKLSAIGYSKYLPIEAQESLNKLIEEQAVTINNGKSKIIALHNLGLLLEQTLRLNTVNLLKEFSKNITIIIIWEHTYSNGLLHWGSQQDEYHINLSDIHVAEENAKYEV